MLDINQIIIEDLKQIADSKINWNSLRDKSVMVTGANGLIASYLVYTLVYLNEYQNGNIRIFALARNAQRLRKRFGTLLDRGDITVVIQDVCSPLAIENKIDYIIHAASQTGPSQFTDTPVDTALANMLGTYNLLEFAKKQDDCTFMFLSTREIYGKGRLDLVTETDYGEMDPACIRSCYPESKRMAETLCVSYAHQFNVHCKIARIAHTYGPGMALKDGRVVGDFLGNVVDGEDINMNSDGSGKLALTYISDLTIGLYMTLCDFKDDVYNISNSSEIITVKELAQKLCSIFSEKRIALKMNQISCEKKSGYLKYKPGILDSSKAERMGLCFNIPLDEGLKRTVEYYVSLRR